MQTAKRVLLVEDDIDDQELFSEALARIHPTVCCDIANNGAEALEMIENPPAFDIVFMDLNMPKMNGIECLKHLKVHPVYKHVPVIIISTSVRVEEMEKCKELGAAKYFPKPASFDVLFNNLRNILAEIAGN